MLQTFTGNFIMLLNTNVEIVHDRKVDKEKALLICL